MLNLSGHLIFKLTVILFKNVINKKLDILETLIKFEYQCKVLVQFYFCILFYVIDSYVVGFPHILTNQLNNNINFGMKKQIL